MGLIFDGIDLKTNYNFVVTNINGRGSPPVSRTMLELPRIDGAIELNSKLQSRNITIRGYVYGTDASTKKDALIKLITQAYSREKKLTFPDTNRSIYVKLAGEPIVLGPVGPVLNAQAYELTFNFVAQDPYFYGEDHDESGFRIVKVNANAPTYLISPRRKFLKREASLKIEPYTIANLLGKYGDFETDSNGDGLADGWSIGSNVISKALVNGIDGNKAQKITANSIGNNAKNRLFMYKSRNAGEKWFFSAYLYCAEDCTKVNLGMDGETREIMSSSATSWDFVYAIITMTTTGSHQLFFYPESGIDGGNNTFVVDKFFAINLTAMGTLPYGLQQYFAPAGVQLWEDLATTSNIKAIDDREQSGEAWLAELLPYVNGIASLGFAWEGI